MSNHYDTVGYRHNATPRNRAAANGTHAANVAAGTLRRGRDLGTTLETHDAVLAFAAAVDLLRTLAPHVDTDDLVKFGYATNLELVHDTHKFFTDRSAS
jgi:uncharacterized membrane-anchored protein